MTSLSDVRIIRANSIDGVVYLASIGWTSERRDALMFSVNDVEKVVEREINNQAIAKPDVDGGGLFLGGIRSQEISELPIYTAAEYIAACEETEAEIKAAYGGLQNAAADFADAVLGPETGTTIHVTHQRPKMMQDGEK